MLLTNYVVCGAKEIKGKMNLCACGCGLSVKRRFHVGHNRRGVHHTDDAKERIRVTSKLNLEDNQGRWKRGQEGPPTKFKEGCTPWDKGMIIDRDKYPQMGHQQPHTQESRELMSESHKETYREGAEPWNKGLTKCNDFRVMRISKTLSDGACWNKGLTKYTDVRLMKQSVIISKKFEDPEYMKKILHRRTPSGPEQTFIDLCKEFKYVGNGELNIDGKNPDFVCIGDEYKLIEIWGDYFKIKQKLNPQDRIDFFKVRGYDCLVIWASELRNPEKILERIKEFIEA